MIKIPCERFSRVVGYFRPVENWNIGKQVEFKDRKVFIINEEVKNEEASIHES